MVDIVNSSATSEPPPPLHPPKSSLPMLYYGLIVIGTAAIVLAVYNLIIIKWCTNQRLTRSSPSSSATINEVNSASASTTTNQSSNSLMMLNRQSLLPSFKHKKELGLGRVEDDEECSVCLSVFEDGEEVRKLPHCKHTFHGQCIDMWLRSHYDCPLCRAPVSSVLCHRHMVVSPVDSSRQAQPEYSATSATPV